MTDPNQQPVTPPEQPAAPAYTQPAAPAAPGYSQPAAPNYPAPGAPAGAYGQPYTGAAAPSKTLSLIAMITGIIGVISFGYGLLFSIAAIVLGFMGKKKEPAAKGFWMTGIITGFVGVLWTIILIIVFIAIFAAAASSGSLTTY